jgi:hypothetical protein
LIESVSGLTRATAAYRLIDKKGFQEEFIQGKLDLFKNKNNT